MNTKLEKLYSLAAKNEEALLGSVLLLPRTLDTIKVSSMHFADSRLGSLFELVQNLHDKGQPIDSVTLYNEIKRSDLDWSVEDLGNLFNLVPNAANAYFYQSGVLDAYRRRTLISVAERILDGAVDPTCETETLLAEAENKLDALTSVECTHTLSMAEACEQAHDQIFAKDKTETKRMVTTGFHGMDQTCGLISAGEMVVIAARPACGKTSLAWQIAEHCGERGKHVLFASLEMGPDEIVRRAVSGQTGVTNTELRGTLREEKIQEVKDSLLELAKIGVTLFVPPRSTLRQIRAAAKLKSARDGLSMIVIDYLGLIRSDGSSRGKYEDTTIISQDIKAMARNLQVPVLVLCQLNREAEGVTPMLKHLRDSGAIEQDADRVIFLEPHDWSPMRRTDFNLIVAKNRGGQTSMFDLKFDGPRTRFTSPHYHSEFANN